MHNSSQEIKRMEIVRMLNNKGKGVDYHMDHLSSSNVVTGAEGDVYEHMEYTPYGEKWILDQNDNSKYDMIPYRFTAKEWDEETGLYYMSARYMNPVSSRWVSSDPAGWGLVNPMEQDEQGEFQMRSGYSIVESMNPYVYVSNNPLKFVDPTGFSEVVFAETTDVTEHNMPDSVYFSQQSFGDDKGISFDHGFSNTACAATSLLNELSTEYTSMTGKELTMDQVCQ